MVGATMDTDGLLKRVRAIPGVMEASIMHGRRYIGIELNPEYIELANRRFAETINSGAGRDDELFPGRGRS